MFRTVEDFLDSWKMESNSTLRVFGALSDASLSQSVAPGAYSLDSLAKHITISILKIPEHAGLLTMPAELPAMNTVAEIVSAYEHNAKQVANAAGKLNSEQLAEEIPVFGRTMRRGQVLTMLIAHQGHHRAQMTVLMRQAGLKVPGVYGPSEADKAAIAAKK
jgi:uncharacterized damage-inducible protein DinB